MNLTNSVSISGNLWTDWHIALQNPRWGTEFLIPLKDFSKVLKSGISSISDICEKLELPEPVVNMRLKFISRQHESIKIDKTHSLILTCYPRIFIYEDIQY